MNTRCNGKIKVKTNGKVNVKLKTKGKILSFDFSDKNLLRLNYIDFLKVRPFKTKVGLFIFLLCLFENVYPGDTYLACAEAISLWTQDYSAAAGEVATSASASGPVINA